MKKIHSALLNRSKALPHSLISHQSMKVRLQPPSATELAPFNPILPPASITQIMLLANPTKVRCMKSRHRICWWWLMRCILTGEGANALQAGFHTRGPPLQRGGWGRPVSPTRDVGAPIVAHGSAASLWGGEWSSQRERKLYIPWYLLIFWLTLLLWAKKTNVVLVFFLAES